MKHIKKENILAKGRRYSIETSFSLRSRRNRHYIRNS